MRKIAVSLLTVVAVFLLSVASGFGWGTDVQIYSGQINTFDVDYDLATGSMFVAFQASGEDVIRLYSSTDHGINWSEIASFGTHPYQGTTARSDLKRLKVIYNDGRVQVFWVDSAGSLNRWRCSSTGGQPGGSRVSEAPIVEGSFSATLDVDSGRIYVGWRTGITGASRQIVRYSDDNGLTWKDRINWTAYAGSAPQSLAYGPGSGGNHIHWVFGTEQYGSTEEIKYFRFPSSSGVWDKSERISNNSIADYDPRVAAANVDDSGVWILYNRDRGAHEIDLMNAYSTDGGVTWSAPSAVDADDGIDEYIADVKFYKAPGNPYVNMVYIKDDPNATPVRQAVWMYASTGDPSWREPQVFSDEDVQSWPEDTAPRIVYSPGASAPGGGVVFSYAGAQGLYFDAPWIIVTGGFLPVYPFPVYPLLPSHTLTVTIHGSGSVVSSPAGLDCTNGSLTGDKVCSHNFIEGTAVALTATPIDGVSYTSSFGEWSGDCTGSGACPLVMDGDKSVEAQFTALGIPVFALPVPAGQEAWSYPPVENPLLQSDPADCKPFAVGDLMTGNLNLQVGLPPFSAGVDIYLALEFSGALYLINGSNELKLSSTLTELPRWKTNASFADINESLYGDIPLALLPTGLYNLYIAVTPTGETDFSHYYFWSTYFMLQ
ncbi:MAG: hypothetical protein U9P07_02235 [Pseudomonadota bacterium]|nr:hypothetical protein [Pseudomonadota bacterium]